MIKRDFRFWLAAAGLMLAAGMSGAAVFSASAPAGSEITVYESPT